MAGVRFLLAGRRPARPGRVSGAARVRRARPGASGATSAIVGALLLGGGMGLVALGEQTIPSGIAALLIAMMPVWVAIFGRHLPRRAAAAAGRRRHRRRASSGSRILVGPSIVGGDRRPRPGRARGRHPLADRLGARLAVRLARATPAARPARCDRRCQMLAGGARPGRHGVADRRARPTFDPAAVSPRLDRSRFVYLTVVGSLLAFTAYGWLLRVAPLPLVATYAYVNPVVAVILGGDRPRRSRSTPRTDRGRRRHRRRRCALDRRPARGPDAEPAAAERRRRARSRPPPGPSAPPAAPAP